jgi:hypothetical protein
VKLGNCADRCQSGFKRHTVSVVPALFRHGFIKFANTTSFRDGVEREAQPLTAALGVNVGFVLELVLAALALMLVKRLAEVVTAAALMSPTLSWPILSIRIARTLSENLTRVGVGIL